MSSTERDGAVAVYCVATPLHLLAARQVQRHVETGARSLLLPYRPGARSVLDPADWDQVLDLPWPRWEPLPGPFGVHRRMRENLARVAEAVGHCRRLHLHAPVFDTEVINPLLQGLARSSGAQEFRARLLPDGLLNTARHPLSPLKRAAQQLRRLRSLAAPELRYTPFAGCRTGAEADFLDRIYLLPGLPHDYPAQRCMTLPPLVDPAPADGRPLPRRALVLGQPLAATGLLDADGLAATTAALHAWLMGLGLDEIRYKAHPRDRQRELWHPDYRELQLDEPLEAWMAREPHAVVAGVHSTGLVFARQIHGPAARVASFGWHHLRFKRPAERARLLQVFDTLGIERPEGPLR